MIPAFSESTRKTSKMTKKTKSHFLPPFLHHTFAHSNTFTIILLVMSLHRCVYFKTYYLFGDIELYFLFLSFFMPKCSKNRSSAGFPPLCVPPRDIFSLDNIFAHDYTTIGTKPNTKQHTIQNCNCAFYAFSPHGRTITSVLCLKKVSILPIHTLRQS